MTKLTPVLTDTVDGITFDLHLTDGRITSV